MLSVLVFSLKSLKVSKFYSWLYSWWKNLFWLKYVGDWFLELVTRLITLGIYFLSIQFCWPVPHFQSEVYFICKKFKNLNVKRLELKTTYRVTNWNAKCYLQNPIILTLWKRKTNWITEQHIYNFKINVWAHSLYTYIICDKDFKIPYFTFIFTSSSRSFLLHVHF